MFSLLERSLCLLAESNVFYPPKEEMRIYASQQEFTCNRGETQEGSRGKGFRPNLDAIPNVGSSALSVLSNTIKWTRKAVAEHWSASRPRMSSVGCRNALNVV
jgi:hypothetical protein